MVREAARRKAERTRSTRWYVAAALGVVAIAAVTVFVAVRNGAGADDVTSQSKALQAKIAKPESADRSLTEFTCEPDLKGRWDARGTLLNSVDRSADYVVTASLLGGDGEVIAMKSRAVRLDAAESAPVEFSGLYEGSDEGLSCTAQVIRSARQPQ